MVPRSAWIRRYASASILIAVLVLSGCAAPGSAIEPTVRPLRLLESTPSASAPAAAPTAQPTSQPARPVAISGLIDDLDEQGLRVGGTLVVIDPTTRISGTPARGAWVQVRGNDDDDDDGRIVARDVTVLTTTAQVVGPLETVSGELWTIGGVTVRVPITLQPTGLTLGRTVRAVVRLRDDDDDGGWYEALLVEPARTLALTGQVTLVDAGGYRGGRTALRAGAWSRVARRSHHRECCAGARRRRR